jgi:rSAM/selenodomain-associated transferase 2
MLSIIIPARNDADALRRTLDHLAALAWTESVEVIVAASGDVGGTTSAVGNRATLIWPQESTRAALMNAGAATALGDVLLFLHADSLLPRHALQLIDAALNNTVVLGGAFEHRFLERDWRLRVISALNRVRYRLTRNYYGDQGMFVRAATFWQLGGFRMLSLMEDLDFSQRLKRLGATQLIRVPLDTSGRRFLRRGPWRTFLECGSLLTLWTLGLDTERYAERWRGPADQRPGSHSPRAPYVA